MIFESQAAWAPTIHGPVPGKAPRLQRKCACGGTPGPTGECEECKAKKKRLQRRALGAQSETHFAPGAECDGGTGTAVSIRTDG